MRLKLHLLCLFVLLFTACKKENTTISAGNSEPSLLSSSIDTFSINSFSFELNDIPSNQAGEVFLGAYSSSEVGLTTHILYSTLTPTDLTFRIPDEGLNVNSVTLTIKANSAYGTVYTQEFKVLQLKSKISSDATYYTSDSIITDTTTLGTFQLTNKDAQEVSIALSNSIGEKIINEGNVAFTTAEVFSDLFNGIAIEPISVPNSNNGCVYAISATEITLSINCSGKTTGTSYALTFKPSGSTKTSYYCKKNRAGSKTANLLTNSSLADDEFYIQGTTALSSRITFSSIKNWYISDNHIINKATLTFYVIDATNTAFTPPTSLTCHVKGSTTSEGIQATYNTSTKAYNFEIEPLLATALLSEDEISFNVSALNANIHPEQVTIAGKNNNSLKPTLKVFYTKY